MSEPTTTIEEGYRMVKHSDNLAVDWIKDLLKHQHEKTLNDVCERLRLEEKGTDKLKGLAFYKKYHDKGDYYIDVGYDKAVEELNEKIKEIKGE